MHSSANLSRLSAVVMSIAVGAAALVSPAHANGQELGLEITPIGGYRYGGTLQVAENDTSWDVTDSSSIGLIVNLPHDTNTKYEFAYFEQTSSAELDGVTIGLSFVNLDQRTLQIGGIYEWGGDNVRPYMAASIGGTRIEAAGENDTFFSGSIGLGVMINPASRFGIRLEARAHGVFINSDTDLLCRTGPDINICAIRVEGDMLSQIDTFAGFVYRF